MNDSSVSRRGFLNKLGGIGAGLMLAPTVSLAKTEARERKISFRHLHTGERLNATYWADGAYVDDELSRINWLLRDFRNDQRTQIDPDLLDILYRIGRRLDTKSAFHVISAYRSPETNEMLIRKGHGVARRSMHLTGRAIDIRVPGRRLKDVRGAALAMAAGGVGYYPSSNFLHLDTGRVRRW